MLPESIELRLSLMSYRLQFGLDVCNLGKEELDVRDVAVQRLSELRGANRFGRLADTVCPQVGLTQISATFGIVREVTSHDWCVPGTSLSTPVPHRTHVIVVQDERRSEAC